MDSKLNAKQQVKLSEFYESAKAKGQINFEEMVNTLSSLDIEPEQFELVLDTPVSYTHLRAHETVLDLVCRLLLEKKKQKIKYMELNINNPEIITSHIPRINTKYN